MNPEIVLELIDELSSLKYFPGSASARVAIARMIGSMASSKAQVERLIERMTDGSTFNEWPGPQEMRACFCSMFKPKDGIEAGSEIYPDGFPSFRPQAPQIGPGERKRLNPGEPVSADAELDAMVQRAAAKRRAMLAKPATKDEIAELLRIQRERAQNETTREILDRESGD